jgi:hypothetical protein
MGKNLIVLGAGASIGSKREGSDTFLQKHLKIMPSSENYFYDISCREPQKKGQPPFLNTLALTFEHTYKLITYIYDLRNNTKGFFPEEWKGVNMESVFSFFDISTQMLHANSDFYKSFSFGKENLMYYIVFDLQGRCEGQHCEYLKSVFNKLSSKDSILSFNWDTIADNTLQLALPEQYQNYQKMFNEENINEKKWRKKGNLLKLHGSINWYFCNNRKCHEFKKIKLLLDKKGKLESNLIFHKKNCKKCGIETELLIIPPSLNKIISKHKLVHKQWLLAREKLLDIERIVFIGYSFPANDIISEWLFRHIYLTTKYKESKSLPEVIVVNPQIVNRNSMVYRRYKSIFPNIRLKKFKTLKEFCQKGLDLIN